MVDPVREQQINEAIESSKLYDRPYTIGGSSKLLPVIEIGLKAPLLSHTTARVGPNLNEMDEWQAVKDDPYSDAAQEIIAECVRNGGDPDQYEQLKQQLWKDGQEEPGLMTTEGVLIQGNTRLIALRELAKEEGHFVKFIVAVIDKKVPEEDLRHLDWEEQHREKTKRDYPLANQLIALNDAIEEGRTPAQIATTMNIKPAEVEARHRAYKVFEEMRHLPTPPITIARFNTLGSRGHVSLEALKDLGKQWWVLVDAGKDREATSLLRSWLLAGLSGGEQKQTRDLRKITGEFADNFVLPEIENLDDANTVHAALRAIADTAIATKADSTSADPLDGPDESTEGDRVVAALVNALAGTDSTVEISGQSKRVTVPREELKRSVGAVMDEAIAAAKGEDAADEKLRKPLKHLKQAARSLELGQQSVRKAQSDDEFATQKGAFETAFKRARRQLDAFEKEINAAFEGSDK